MKVLIVARTRQGAGACVGGIAFDGASVRLLPPPAAEDRWGLAFGVGEVWEVEGEAEARPVPPHVEGLVVRARRRLGPMTDPVPFIERHAPPLSGGPEALFEGRARALPSGALYVSEATGLPARSTHFWRCDRPLVRDAGGKRLRYRYGGDGRSLVFVGFQEPVEEIPAGTLLRVSLAHWWRPPDDPDAEPRCFVQLSGWFSGDAAGHDLGPPPAEAGEREEQPAPVRQPPAAAGRDRPDLDAARGVLRRVFGYDGFRPLQEEIIGRVLAGRDALGVMPTGSGKSLCYQIPALLIPGLTVVVSPLLSLMQDQMDQLRELGIPAVTLNSTLSHAAYAAGARAVREGEVKLLYVAPETLLRPETGVLLDQSRVACLTVDEAHCISEWGHDFRPEYRHLRGVRQRYPGAACLALTATATERVRADIQATLGIPREDCLVAGFDRPNLFLEVRRRDDSLADVLEFLAGRPDQPGIVYCSTREQVDTLAAELAGRGISALPYHAGLDDAARRTNQRLFQRDDVRVIVATVAFGMGINKPNVRFVVHRALPDCLETYYQQVGRAGRDGERSECLLLFARGDAGTAYHFIQQGTPAERAGRMARLQAMVRYAEATACRRRSLLQYFGDPPPDGSCGMCDNCLAETAGRVATDVSAEARLFLGCVLQTGQRFGPAHVVDVLRGSQSARVLRWKHERLDAHGSGRHLPAERWRALADRFVEHGLVEAEQEHGTLRITAAGRAVMAGAAVSVVVEDARAAPRAAERAQGDPVLFEALRALRKELADAAGVPPYVIFADRSLQEMALFCPRTPEAFLRIHGVGERRAATYGARFMEVIERHGAPPGAGAPAPAAGELLGKRSREVGEAFRAGRTLRELQEQWEVTQQTIVSHLYACARAGIAVDAGRVLAECRLPPDQQSRVIALFNELGRERLGPVHAALEGKVGYPDLHLLRLYHACLGQE